MRKMPGADPVISDELADRGYVDAQRACLPASGEYVYSDGILQATAGALTTGRFTAHPMWVAPGTYDALVVSVGTALVAGSATIVSQVGVYADDPGQGSHYIPLTLAPIVSGAVPLTATGLAVAVLATPWTSPGGFYWGGYFYSQSAAPSTAPTLACVSNCTYSIGQTSTFTTRVRGWGRTGLAALPTTATTPANATRSIAADIPVVGLRRA